MREGTTWRVMAADVPYGEFYDFYTVSPEYFGYTLVYSIRNAYIFLCVLLKKKQVLSEHVLTCWRKFVVPGKEIDPIIQT
jgi:hypothetical protein